MVMDVEHGCVLFRVGLNERGQERKKTNRGVKNRMGWNGKKE